MYNFNKVEFKDFLKRYNKLQFNFSDYLNNSIKYHNKNNLSYSKSQKQMYEISNEFD